tara:strand:- start:3185 stop:4504 length:1320 start_codon:yes stop_codon:yes gene_type:complete
MDKFFHEHVMKLQPELIGMTVGGVLCDTRWKDMVAEELRNEVQNLRERFDDAVRVATGDETLNVNPRSPRQLGDLLFRQLRLVGRGTSTNKENRKRMLGHPGTSPEAKAVIERCDKYLTEAKFSSTYAEMKVDPDDRVRCEYKQYGVANAPGRLSSAKTMWGTGMNMQNQPHRAYAMFRADPDFAMTYFDLSQAEARVVSRIAMIPALIENFRLAEEAPEKYDVHRLNAARIFQCDYNAVPKEDWTNDGKPTKRFLGKRCVHGLNYRMGPDKLATVCDIPYSQAQEAYIAYHRAFPEIKQWWDDTIRKFKHDRMLMSAMGRRIILLERSTDDAMDSIVAFYPQSTIGDKVGQCIYLCHNDPRWPRLHDGTLQARMILNIHDALIALHQDTDEMREICSTVMKEHAEAPIIIRGEPLSIPAEIKFSQPDKEGIHRWSTIQ